MNDRIYIQFISMALSSVATYMIFWGYLASHANMLRFDYCYIISMIHYQIVIPLSTPLSTDSVLPSPNHYMIWIDICSPPFSDDTIGLLPPHNEE